LLALTLEKWTTIVGGQVGVVEEVLLPFQIAWVTVKAEVRVCGNRVPSFDAFAYLIARLTPDHLVGNGVDEHAAWLKQQHHAGSKIATMSLPERRARANHEGLHAGKRKLPVFVRRVRLGIGMRIGVNVVQVLQNAPEQVVIRRVRKRLAIGFEEHCNVVLAILR